MEFAQGLCHVGWAQVLCQTGARKWWAGGWSEDAGRELGQKQLLNWSAGSRGALLSFFFAAWPRSFSCRFGPTNEYVRLVRKNCRTLLDNVEVPARAWGEGFSCLLGKDAMVRLAMGREVSLCWSWHRVDGRDWFLRAGWTDPLQHSRQRFPGSRG